MDSCYDVQVRIGRQEDGLWRVEVPGLAGCWVDAPTLAVALSEIQEVIAMTIDVIEEEGGKLPKTIRPRDVAPETASLPVIVREHHFSRPKPPKRSSAVSR
jgi:predicted RNase H-like HicB family nuclease